MKIDVRYANHPADSKFYTTDELREHYLVEHVFVNDSIQLTYSHQDRIIAGGIMPVKKELSLTGSKELASEYFLERRELGVINIGGPGQLTIDGANHLIDSRDGFYIGMGVKELVFKSMDESNPAKFYVNSAPAHRNYPSTKIEFKSANPVRLGETKTLNKRTIYQYVHPAVCQSCQLVMGMTLLEPGSAWNTMPTHTHERRMEVYFYFGMSEEARVFHFMGEPTETRHLVVANEQLVVSPSWSIHSGVGTSDYIFIWGMCGENQTFTDMDHIPMNQLK